MEVKTGGADFSLKMPGLAGGTYLTALPRLDLRGRVGTREVEGKMTAAEGSRGGRRAGERARDEKGGEKKGMQAGRGEKGRGISLPW